MQLTQLHLQLTSACNLHCTFCGQAREKALMSRQDWFSVLEQAAVSLERPTVTIWGGEALLSPDFAAVSEYAAKRGFFLELITNGTLLDRFAELLRGKFQRIYVSVDGPEAVHDRFRGKGTFAKVRCNLEMIAGGRPELVMMSVLTEDTLKTIGQVPFGLPIDRAIFHELIYLAPEELPESAEEWHKNYTPEYQMVLQSAVERFKEQIFPIPVEFQPHPAEGICREPWRHLHVRCDGECGFCTDFTHYTVGNVRKQTLEKIFSGKAAEAFRSKVEKGECIFCRHCSWKNTPEQIIHFPYELK